ncbi:MAG: ABC transporter ATP-binding protein [Synergistaceae bacterium]|jgi:branched-chain amino acid transport system ATP-binding protein|nr:ABC transporter ATP-binding protein [Synergistaceae bacterium]
MLDIQNLNIWYGGIHAVKGIDVSIQRGEIVTLIGANGAGKSSTIRAIAGLVRGFKGFIGYTPHSETQPIRLNGRQPEEMVRMGIALSPEGRRILPQLTVEENLRLGAYTRNDKVEIAHDMNYVYDLFPRLKERRSQKGGTLSGGEQQMLAVGRALMSRPDLLMLDEPSLGLAPMLVGEVFDVIREINRQGKTILLVEQNAFAALSIAHKAYVLEVGSIALQGTGKELLHNPQVREAYLGG